jgi:hypothetical protein
MAVSEEGMKHLLRSTGMVVSRENEAGDQDLTIFFWTGVASERGIMQR